MIIDFQKIKRARKPLRTRKVTVAVLSLSIEAFSADKVFCTEARSCIRTVGADNVCFIPDWLHSKIFTDLDVESAVAENLYN